MDVALTVNESVKDKGIRDYRIVLLMDMYGCLLRDGRRDKLVSFFEKDLSLSEIARISGISRQAVLYSINTSIQLLRGYERKMQLVAKMVRIRALLDKNTADMVYDVLICEDSLESGDKAGDNAVANGVESV